MNTPKFSILIFSSVFVLASCSTAPTSQSMGKNIGTAMILGGLAYGGNSNDSKDDSDSSKGKEGGAIALAGLAIHYFIAKSETAKEMKNKRIEQQKQAILDRKQAIIDKEQARKQAIIDKEQARKQAIIDKKESVIRDNPNHRDLYKSTEINNFKSYYRKTNIKISPNTTGLIGDPIYIDITAPHPYKSSQFSAITYLSLNNMCSFSKNTRKKRDDEKSLADSALEIFNVKSEVTTKNLNCKKIPQHIVNKRVRFFKAIGVKEGSSLMKLAKRSTFKSKMTENAERSFDKSLGELIASGINNPTPTPVPTSASSNPKKSATAKKGKERKKHSGKYSGGVRSISRLSSLRYNKYPEYKIICNGGGSDNYYHYTEKFHSVWRRSSGIVLHSYQGEQYKTIKDIARKHCSYK